MNTETTTTDAPMGDIEREVRDNVLRKLTEMGIPDELILKMKKSSTLELARIEAIASLVSLKVWERAGFRP